ncbi:MAG: polyamine ABC transporter ATP-binding protein, partial [Syntrophales bacterium]|nr:polyamine ABC transporter ATP-binding protein [Syntrophales bacterium]
YTLIKEINEDLGTTMIIVTHDLDLIFGIVHRLIMLDGNEKGIIAVGTPAALRDASPDPRVRRFLSRRERADS